MGLGAQAALALNQPFLTLIREGRPFVILKAAMSQDGRIAELVPAGNEPATPGVRTFDASEHVVLPGLINTHHHFYQTLTRAVPAALDRELFPWLQAL